MRDVRAQDAGGEQKRGTDDAPALAANASLTKLDMRSNRLGAEGEEAIKKAVSGKEGFQLLI